MRASTIHHLLTINQEFYQKFGAAFAQTRQRVQPGVARVVASYLHDGDWLDLGCGSGALLKCWAKHGLQGSYTGLDFSAALLKEAENARNCLGETPGLEIMLLRGDLLDEKWTEKVDGRQYDGVLAFASLHHIPGSDTRLRLLKQIKGLLRPWGLFIHSEWQFQNSPKLMSRVQPWSLTGIDEGDLEPGDTLLDWRHTLSGQAGSSGLRYVHLFNEGELADLAVKSGFAISEQFHSDGAGEKLAIYQVWRKI